MHVSVEAMTVVKWHRGKMHVSADGVVTVCGALITPAKGGVVATTAEWPRLISCYNCAYRCTPKGFVAPSSGQDFPLRRECPTHRGQAVGQCRECNPETIKPQSWPCPNGCTDPKAHDPMFRYTRCTVFPPRHTDRAGERCSQGCKSTESVVRAANAGLNYDLADSASMTCYHCGGYVCLVCRQRPVEGSLMFCDLCDHHEAHENLAM